MYNHMVIRFLTNYLMMILLLVPFVGLGQSIQISAKEIAVKSLLAELESKSKVNFIYSDLGNSLEKKIKLTNQSGTVRQLLNDVERQSDLRFTINKQDIIIRRLTKSDPSVKQVSIEGRVIESGSTLALGYTTLQLRSKRDTSHVYRTVAGSDGRFVFVAVAKGQYILQASYIGYLSDRKELNLQSNQDITMVLKSENRLVEEINVTAMEQKGMATSSVIKREAIEHMQATSLTDLLSLLPGGQSVPPSLNAPNLIRLREANAPVGADYAISSLGTLFVIDDMPISTDANLQAMNVAISGTDQGGKQYVNAGMDMRGIITDNIEKVEIIRGIPSVRYGDLTSGVVKIDRLLQPLPLEARFKLDQFSKLFALSKGVKLAKNWLVVGDFTYLDGKRNPVNPLENYDRYTASLRAEKYWGKKDEKQLRWRLSADYTGQFDDWKQDAEQLAGDLFLEQGKYRLSYKSMGFSSRLSLKQPKKILRQIEFNANLKYSIDYIYREMYPNNTQERGIIPLSLTPGVSEAIVLPGKYKATHEVDGRPFNAFATLRGDLAFHTGFLTHNGQIGTEWRMDKNYGAGQLFDIARPINNSFGVRPYRFDRIPANQHFSYYVEDRISLPKIAGSQLHIQAGLRGGMMINLDKAYSLNGKIYNDPRVNIQLALPAIRVQGSPLNFTLTGGIGWLSKMPTMSMLYPDIVYQDFVEFKHNNVKPEYSYSQLRTYIEDRVNYNLSYTRNKKKELRVDAEWKGHLFSVTLFDELLTNGFRSMDEPKAYYYQYYGMLNVPTYGQRPDLTNMPYEERTVFRGVTRRTNGSQLSKQGMEFTFTTPRYPGIATRFTLNGAYFKNGYQNSLPMWFLGSSRNNPVVDGVIVFDNYAAYYPNWQDGFDRSRTSTSFTADTYIKQHGLTLSLTAETYWKGKNDQYANNPEYPSYYLTTDNVLHPYTEADKSHRYLQYLFYPDEYSGIYLDNKSLTTLHFRGSKDFGKWLRLSLFVLNFADITPHYNNYQGVRVKDASTAPYFGMELKLKL